MNYYVDILSNQNKVEAAIAREKQMKGWNRKRKDKLIAGMNPNWEDLYEGLL